MTSIFAPDGRADTAPTPIARYRVWHIPQVPGKPFVVELESLDEAQRLLDILADYDAFQYEHNIKPDYCNVNGVEVWEDGEWCEVDEDFAVRGAASDGRTE